jgi:TraB/PrgY/gumN family
MMSRTRNRRQDRLKFHSLRLTWMNGAFSISTLREYTPLAMYFTIEGSNVRLAGTMHRVPKGHSPAPWVHDAIGWASVIYIEHDKEKSDRLRLAPLGSQPIARRLPRSWSRINLTFSDRRLVLHLAILRPSAVASDVLGAVPSDEGVELLAIARSKDTAVPRPRIMYLETAEESYAFEDGVSDEVWDAAVSWVLDNKAEVTNAVEASYSAWVGGDFEELDRIHSLRTPNRFEPIKRAVVTERNKLWLPRICDLVESAKEPTFVLVGAAHLGGAEGLFKQLSAMGLKLTQVV